MTAALRPYLTFPGTTREAMTFYGEALGAVPQLATFADFGAVAADSPHADKIMHAALDVDEMIRLYATDHIEGMAPGPFAQSTSMTLALMGEDADEQRLTRAFEALSAGGRIKMPLRRQVWGADYGSFTDRFGVGWQVNIGG